MEGEYNKMDLWIYYIGLIAGILFMNDAFFRHPDLADQLMEQFRNLDKFLFISKKEYLFYILIMRGKQFLFLFLCYLFFPKHLMLLFLNLYLSFCLGGFLSLESYYQGLYGIFCGISFFFPHYLCYGVIYYLAYRQIQPGKRKLFLNDKKAFVCAVVLCLFGCILECYGNSLLMMKLN